MVADYNGNLWCIDSGNDRYNGQVLIGNMTDVSQIRLDPLGICTGLPSPYLQEPDLLESNSTEQSLSCAELTLAEEQSLMVNRMAATVVAQYVTELVLRREIRHMGTVFNLAPPTMSSQLITKTDLDNCRKICQSSS